MSSNFFACFANPEGLTSQTTTEPTCVFVFSLDDVITCNERVGFGDFSGFISKALTHHPWIGFYGAWNYKSLYQQGSHLSNTKAGLTNIVGSLIEKVSEEKKCDLSHYTSDIVEHSVKPKPLHDVIAYIKLLKNHSSLIFGATVHDTDHHKIYSEKLKNHHDIDLDDLFLARLTVPVEKQLKQTQEPFEKLKSGLFSVTHAVKGCLDPAYFNKLKMLINDYTKEKNLKIVYIDSDDNHLVTAQNAGFETVKIQRPVRVNKDVPLAHANKTELQNLAKQCKEDLEKLCKISSDLKS